MVKAAGWEWGGGGGGEDMVEKGVRKGVVSLPPPLLLEADSGAVWEG